MLSRLTLCLGNWRLGFTMTLAFVLFVLIGFIFQFLATLPGTGPYCLRIAWGSWLAAAVMWAIPQFH